MIYQFNNREVDVDSYQIRVDGKVLSVEPKVFDLILYLITHRDRIISRDELFENIWAGRTVSDTSLSNHIKSARKVLGDNGELQCIIKTVRSRGYQFIAFIEQPSSFELTVEENLKLTSPTTSSRASLEKVHSKNKAKFNVRLLFIASFILVFLVVLWQLIYTKGKSANEPYLLVVPFSISSNSTANWQAFSDQLTRELIQDLRKVSGLKVVPPPSSFTFKSNKIRTHIKEQLPEVNHVLDGVISEGKNGQLRLTIELENITTGSLLWDGDFDIQKDNKNLFVTQSNIASSVSKSLKVIMLDDEKRVLAQAPTSSLQAYDYFIQGHHQLSIMTHQSVLNAIEYFNKAIALDKEFEAAYIAKSNAYRIIMVLFDKPRDILPKVISSAIDVLSINPNSAQVMSLLGLAYVHAWQWEDGWKMLSKAKEKNPTIALTELGFTLYYSAMGDVEGVKRSLANANALDPLNEEIAEWGMWSLMMVGEIETAIKWGEEKRNLHAKLPYPLLSLAVAKYMKKNFDKSISLAEKGVKLSQRAPFPLILLAQSYAASGDEIKAQQLLQEAQDNKQYLCPYETAVIYSFLGETDKVFELLNEAVDYQSNCLIFSRHDPRFETLRSDKRFTSILEKLALDDAAVVNYPR